MFIAFIQALRSLRANKGRTALTTLGIVIGIATVILVLSAGAGFQGLIGAQIGALGSNTLFIQTRVPPTTKNRAAAVSVGGQNGTFGALAITTLKQIDLDQIRQTGNVVNDYGMVTGEAVASYRNNEKNVIYYGAGAERFAIDQHTLKAGRFYTLSEDAGANQVVILGSSLANDLFGADNPTGQLVRIGDLNFSVIGVYNSLGFAGGGTADDSAYLPLGTAQKKLLGVNYISIAIVQMQDVNLGDSTAAAIKEILRRNHNITDPGKDDFIVETQAQTLDTFNTIFSGVTLLLIAIAAISLVVGGVGIMNIMYVAVTERTAEIGLKKSLGAKRRDILREFLAESVVVTVLGGIIGIGFGAILGWLVAAVAVANGLAWTYSVPLSAVLLGFGVSAGIGLLFGVLPARNAAALDPIEALRYE